MRGARTDSREKGYVTTLGRSGPQVQVAMACPKRWLVILRIELNPTMRNA
jgi:hypothetical protein